MLLGARIVAFYIVLGVTGFCMGYLAMSIHWGAFIASLPILFYFGWTAAGSLVVELLKKQAGR